MAWAAGAASQKGMASITSGAGGSGLATIPHDKGRAPDWVLVTSTNSLRVVSWSPANSDATVIGLFVRNVADGALVDTTLDVSYYAWWD